MKAYNFRFDESDVNTWRELAKQNNQTLSEWIRCKLAWFAKSPKPYEERVLPPITEQEPEVNPFKPSAPVDMKRFLP